MGSRRESPDILGDLMSGNTGIKQESGIEVKQDNHKTSLHENNKTINYASNTFSATKPIDSKEKSTFNLSTTTLEKLEDTWISLRRQIKDKGRITKTLIVERAIELAIEDLKKKGEASFLFQDLSNQ